MNIFDNNSHIISTTLLFFFIYYGNIIYINNSIVINREALKFANYLYQIVLYTKLNEIEDKITNTENASIVENAKPVPKYEDKYLKEIRKLNKEYIFNDEEKELEVDKTKSESDQELRALKDQKQLKFDLHNKLSNIIGDSSGNRFNAMVQRYAMVYLFELANERLKGTGNSRGLMDRYQLSFGGTETPDQVWVIDRHMGNVRRTADAISGGERFVISLALALALSDLASENVMIETMFIDEGFGSLSSEDLDNAITTLERLQVEGGKMVGLISHVDSLKERISTQIQVKKSQNGISTLYLKSFASEFSLQNISG